MSDINWQQNAVCYADGRQWFVNTGSESEKFELSNDDGMRKYSMYGVLNYTKDFQLNEIRTGDFIPAPELELDTEQKYNDVVEVFGLFGFNANENTLHYNQLNTGATHYFASSDYGIDSVSKIEAFKIHCKGRQLTYHQVIAIGKLKRMMLEREKSKLIENASMMKQLRNSELDAPAEFALNYEVNPFTKYGTAKFNPDTMQIKDDGTVIAKPKRRNKSKQAYDILKSLDYEYDLVKQKWFKKQYID